MGMSNYTVCGLYLAGGFIAIGVIIWLGLFILQGGIRIHKQEVAEEYRAAEAVEESYQQEAVERGLAHHCGGDVQRRQAISERHCIHTRYYGGACL